jgi:hypothetical protein
VNVVHDCWPIMCRHCQAAQVTSAVRCLASLRLMERELQLIGTGALSAHSRKAPAMQRMWHGLQHHGLGCMGLQMWGRSRAAVQQACLEMQVEAAVQIHGEKANFSLDLRDDLISLREVHVHEDFEGNLIRRAAACLSSVQGSAGGSVLDTSVTHHAQRPCRVPEGLSKLVQVISEPRYAVVSCVPEPSLIIQGHGSRTVCKLDANFMLCFTTERRST